jgi:molybdopterin-guanine dinucleotide biosynthesis protein A
MTENYLRSLCTQIELGRGVIPKTSHGVEPLVAIYAREAEIDFHQALMGMDFSLQTVTRRQIESGKLREIPVTERDQKLFRNVNEPADLAAL